MDLKSFLESDIAKLPIEIPKGEDLIEHLDTRFADYYKALEALDQDDSVQGPILEELILCIDMAGNIIEALRAYRQGHPARAFKQLSSDFSKRGHNLFSEPPTLYIQPDQFLHFPMYRARIGKSVTPRAKEKLLHIPFEERHKVRSQRYSIPGLPCLYAGSSSYICWLELGEPDFNTLSVASILPIDSLRILDLSYNPSEIFQSTSKLDFEDDPPPVKDDPDRLKHQILSWPLLAACSIKVNCKDKNFIEEHVIPQLVLQLVSDRQIFPEDAQFDGIAYRSVNAPLGLCKTLSTNYVFPVRTSQSSGHCKTLLSKFSLTEPVTYGALNVGGMSASLLGGPHSITRDRTLPLVSGRAPSYGHTHFGIVDEFLTDLRGNLYTSTK